MAAFDPSGIMVIALIVVVVVMGIIIVGMFLRGRPKVQPITKNQYERLYMDHLTSAKLNRIKHTKYIGVLGDKFHPSIPKYFKYVGSDVDGRIVELFGKLRIGSAKRWMLVPWFMLDNLGGKTLWVRCNGFSKDGYFMRPIIPKDYILNGHTWEDIDAMIDEYITVHLHIQSKHDMLEQVAYETLSTASHKDRALAELQQKREYPQTVSTEDEMAEPEG